MSEDELIEACLKGEKAAWDEFVFRYAGVVEWAIRRRLEGFGYNFGRQDIQDIFQDVFLFIWSNKSLAKLKYRGNVAGWVSVVAANRAVDYFRRTRRQMPPKTVSFYEDALKDEKGRARLLEELVPAQVTNPADGAYLKEIDRLIRDAIETLPPRDKMVLKLQLFKGRKVGEISGVMNLNINTVSTIIARAKSYVRKYIKHKGIENF